MKSFSGINLLILLLTVADETFAQTCVKNDLPPAAYLDIAMDMLTKAKDHYQAAEPAKNVRPRDCDDILNLGINSSGIYKIRPQSRIMEQKFIYVYCDMETDGGGWTVIQRRGDFKRPEDYFYKDWESYKKGFGDLEEDFWLGNDNIFAISNQKEYSARFDLTDVNATTKYAIYDYFWIDDEYHKYMLHVKDYRGDAGDSLYSHHDGQNFSTKDQRNDHSNATEGCAVRFKGAWWYNACHDSNLNGLYLKGVVQGRKGQGVIWGDWKGNEESLLKTEMKLRPRHFQRTNFKPTPQPPKDWVVKENF